MLGEREEVSSAPTRFSPGASIGGGGGGEGRVEDARVKHSMRPAIGKEAGPRPADGKMTLTGHSNVATAALRFIPRTLFDRRPQRAN